MDAKSLAKSKRAHSQHHKKHHPSQKAKGTTSSAGASSTDKAPGKAIKEKPHQSQGPAALPSNWDRYEDEYESNTENQMDGHSNQQSDNVLPKSKGADYAYLISEAKSQESRSSSSEIFPSFDDFVTDFDQGKGSFFSVRGESILSSIQNDSFVVEDKATASYEASFLSLDLHALAKQLAKVDLPKRLFMEPDLLPPELFAEGEQESHNSGQDQDTHDNRATKTERNELQAWNLPDEEKSVDNYRKVASYNGTTSHLHTVQNHVPTYDIEMRQSSRTGTKSHAKSVEKQSKLKAATAEAELDMLLNSFTDAKLTASEGSKGKTSMSLVRDVSSQAVPTIPVNKSTVGIDDTLDDLLKDTSTPTLIPSHEVNTAPPPHPVSKSKLLDDFDSWLDTI